MKFNTARNDETYRGDGWDVIKFDILIFLWLFDAILLNN